MRTAGLTMNDVWAGRVLRERGVETHRLEGLEAELGVLVESLELQHRSKAENYRPYLHMTGELRTVTPVGELPFGISQVTYSPGQGERVDAFYEFSDEQLVALTGKGYFTTRFVVPEQLTGIEWALPATVDVVVLAPSGLDDPTDAPVVFTQVRDIASLDIDRDSSGYDLAEYFADHSKDGAERKESVVDERGLRARSDAINSLFTDEELEPAPEGGTPSVLDAQDEAAAPDMSTRIQQVEAEIAAEAEQFRAERERTEGTSENLYRQRVASALQAAEPEQKAAEEPFAPPVPAVRPGVDLDLGLDLDDQVEQAGSQGPTLEERKKEVARRAADLDFGEDGEQSLGS